MTSLAKIPYLDKLTVQKYVGYSSFQKGKAYAMNQAIHQGKLKNSILTALCQGRAFDPYRVEVIFNSKGVQQSYCSCPVGSDGKCKHIAALLLTWLDAPNLFTEWCDLKANLQNYDASTLLELIDLFDDKVNSSSEIIRTFSEHLQNTKTPLLARYERLIIEAFNPSIFPWYHSDQAQVTEMAFAIDKICSDADQLIEEGQLKEAIHIEQSLIQQILTHLNDRGNLGLKRCICSLSKALPHLEKQEQLRLKVFQLLFRIVEEQLYHEVSIGGEEAKQVILQHMRPIERDKIVSWVKAVKTCPLLAKQQKQEELEDFLIDLQTDILEPDIYLTHYQETGQVLKLVDSLLALNRIKEAQNIAQQQKSFSQVLPLANLFIKHHCDAIAEEIVLSFSQDSKDLQCLHWLREFYQKRGDFNSALRFAKQILYLSPQFKYYKIVKELAQKLNKWLVFRKEITEYFKAPQGLGHSLLIEIYLEEGFIKEAIGIFESLSHLSYYSLKKTEHVLLTLNLAEASRLKYPHFSLKVYQNIVIHLIEEHGRDNYRKACDYLKTIKSIFEGLGKAEEWSVYLRSLLQTYHRLKALKDEFSASGLI